MGINSVAMESPFIHLHNHSEFSILDGAFKTKNLIKTVSGMNMKAVALTDHGNIFGAVTFARQAREKNINPIIGCEVYVAPGSRTDKKHKAHEPLHFHLVLLAKNEEGYTNLCRLISSGYLEGFYYRPRIDKDILSRHTEGLIALSACLKGEVSYYLHLDQEERAEKAALEYASIFPPDHFYVELQDHGLPPQQKIRPELIRLARKLDLPLVATNDVHYLNKEDAKSHDILLCVQTNKKVTDSDRIRFGTQEFYFKTSEEMTELFHDVPDAVSNTVKIADRCDFHFPDSGYFLPHFTPPGNLELRDYFEQVVRNGFREKMEQLKERMEKGDIPSREVYEERLEKEIRLVEQMNFEGYFLIVWDLIREARKRKIPVGPGRGSAAGSLLAFSLGITAIDPLEYDLLFERFLNPERISLPDIDIDFCGRRREEVIEYVTGKYGRENVCQIITFGTMAARASVRDIGRALEVPLSQVDTIAKLIPPLGPDAHIAAALKKIPQLRKMQEQDDKISELLSIALKLEGQVRHPSIHAAGIVITPKPLVEFLPLYQSVKGEITTQFPMGDIEAIGLLKMDILGLRNLTVIQDCLEMVKRDLDIVLDVQSIPLDDELSFVLFQNGNTDGVFQFESSGMKDLLRRFKPETFRDLIALNALYRPGPLQSGMTEEFIQCKHDPQRIRYEFPEMEPILKETKGMIVYQEQVMRIATDLADFSMAEADILRKAMGKKNESVMKDQQKNFVNGAKAKGMEASDANKIFEQINYFAGYGFNKSHSAAYAYLAFHTAYLKAHYPPYFLAALLTSEAERGATTQVVKYIHECKEMGITVFPPDINKSELHFKVEDDGIRFGLAAVKNMGEGAILSLIEARRRRKAFSSPFDLCEDLDSKTLNKKVIEGLIKSGAMDSLGWKRSQLFHLVDEIIQYSHSLQKRKKSTQKPLFPQSQVINPVIPAEVKGMREWDESLLLSYEKDSLGFYVTGHPLTQYGDRLCQLVSHAIMDLDEVKDFNSEITLAGIISGFKSLKTKKDERMASFTLEDLGGRIDVVAFPEAFRVCEEVLHDDCLVWVKIKFLGEEDNRRIQILQAMLLEEAFKKQAKRVVFRIFLPGIEKSVFQELKEVLEKYTGECPASFELETPDKSRVVLRSIDIQSVEPSEKLIAAVQRILGEKSVYVEY
ncbi:MAG: DNA polymerase III subunit alpha [Candidatus Aminicenantes bacterium]|nr:DNA polymerase III subunit alpha [Candidatus Aminicenantes bacterium]